MSPSAMCNYILMKHKHKGYGRMVAISYNTLAFENQNLDYVPNTPSE